MAQPVVERPALPREINALVAQLQTILQQYGYRINHSLYEYELNDYEREAGAVDVDPLVPHYNVLRYRADPTGAADSLAAFKVGDLAAALAGERLSVPGGLYAWQGDFTAETIKAQWVGEGSDKVTIAITPSTSNSRVLRIASGDPWRAEQYSASTTAGATKALIDDQSAGLGYVVCSTIAEAANFPVGRYVHVAGGKNPFDADDNLWRYDQLFRVTAFNASTGRVTLAGCVDMDLSSDGFEPGSAANVASAYADATSYGANAYALAALDGSAGSAIWQTPGGGTTSGATLAADTGITDWVLVSNSQGSGSPEDYRPLLQLMPDIRAGTGLQGITFKVAAACVSALELRSIADSSFTDLVIEGLAAIPYYVAESCRNIHFWDCDARGPGGLVGATGYRSASGYNCREIYFHNCDLTGGKRVGSTPYAANYWESFARIHYDNCTLSPIEGRVETYGIYCDVAEVIVTNTRILGYHTPVRRNTFYDAYDWKLDGANLLVDRFTLTGCDMLMRSSGLRAVSNSPAVFNVTNSFKFYDNYATTWSQPSLIRFNPSRFVALHFSWSVAVSQSNAQVNLDRVMDGLVDPQNYKMAVLGLKAYWDTPGADALDIRPQVYNGVAVRGIFTPAADTSSRVQLDDGTAFTDTAEIWDSLGNGHRLVDPNVGERVRLSYYSGASAGGTAHVVLYVLVQEGSLKPPVNVA